MSWVKWFILEGARRVASAAAHSAYSRHGDRSRLDVYVVVIVIVVVVVVNAIFGGLALGRHYVSDALVALRRRVLRRARK